jgi:hypothetical protein
MSRENNRSDDRKLAQLCREAQRVLAQVLPGEVDDPILAGVMVIGVRPAPDASRPPSSMPVQEQQRASPDL